MKSNLLRGRSITVYGYENHPQKRRTTTRPLSLIVCDIDFFKKVNDTYGHQAGDDCLKIVANTLRQQAKRSSDSVARYGGEEFVIVLPETDLATAIEIANNVKNAIYALNIPHINSQTKPAVTISLGVACTDNLDRNDTLFETADRNLYIAKDTGRNKVEPIKINN